MESVEARVNDGNPGPLSAHALGMQLVHTRHCMRIDERRALSRVDDAFVAASRCALATCILAPWQEALDLISRKGPTREVYRCLQIVHLVRVDGQDIFHVHKSAFQPGVCSPTLETPFLGLCTVCGGLLFGERALDQVERGTVEQTTAQVELVGGLYRTAGCELNLGTDIEYEVVLCNCFSFCSLLSSKVRMSRRPLSAHQVQIHGIVGKLDDKPPSETT